MDTEEVCGSKNVFTHLCSLWMDNEQNSHKHWREVARESIEASEKKGQEWFLFEDTLKQHLDDLHEMVESQEGCWFTHNLLGTAISQIDTREIAKTWIELELENMEIA